MKPISIQNLQFEIALLKEEIRAIKEKQELNSLVLQNHATLQSKSLQILLENSTTQDDIEFLNHPEFLTKLLVQIKLVIWDDYILKTETLFDIGTNLSFIQEGLVPTKLFETTKEEL